MKSLKLDSQNNLIYGTTFFTTEGNERILQDIKTRVGMLKGEYPYDKEKGFDYIGYMQNNSIDLKRQIKQECRKIAGVTNLELEIDSQGGLSNFRILTATGGRLNA